VVELGSGRLFCLVEDIQPPEPRDVWSDGQP
jgi:hypothetical protein